MRALEQAASMIPAQPVAAPDVEADFRSLAPMISTAQWFLPTSNENAAKEILGQKSLMPQELLVYVNERGVNNGWFGLIYDSYKVSSMSHSRKLQCPTSCKPGLLSGILLMVPVIYMIDKLPLAFI
jgi:hypothetical protein